MIAPNVHKVLSGLPAGVALVAATKGRTSQEILQAVGAGVEIIGESFVQEAEAKFTVIGRRVRWHLIGHLQRNKAQRAVALFDMIETLDSVRLAEELEKHCAKLGKVMPVLIEINSGRELQKSGVLQEYAERLICEVARKERLKIQGLMTMGPRWGDPEEVRPYFKQTRETFENIKSLNVTNVEMKYLSMGMSDTYEIALEEGANIVRIGTKIFAR